jgi:hypothetical protein
LGLGSFGRCWRQRGFDPSDIAAEVLKAQLHLVLVQPFGPTTKLAALQLLDDQMKPLDLGLCCGEGGALSRQRAHQLLQCCYIVRQGGKIDVHSETLS